jgi:hypothetical protein
MTLAKKVRLRLAALTAVVLGGLVAGGLWAAGPMAASTHVAASTRVAALQVQTSGDGPSGFWYGTDSSYIAIPGPAPYREPAIGGAYGGYIGMIGNWAHWKGCNGKVVWSKTDAADARTNFVTYHKGIGTGAYWFMAGPGVDPHYNGTTAEAYAWGRQQAARALSDLAQRARITYPVIFMDVEIPGDAPSYTPAPDNGWNTVYTSPCSGKVRSYHIAASVDRADFNGFANYLTSHSSYKAGVYSARPIWKSIFGTGTAASITTTYEWTYLADTSSLTHHPYGWCLTNTTICAHFFGGITRASKYALMWQWSGGGGTFNGYGDFDQIDGNRTP